MIVKTDDRALVRDTASGALLNTDTTALARSRAWRQRIVANERQVSKLTREVEHLSSLVRELLDSRAQD